MVGYAFHFKNSMKRIGEKRKAKPQWLEFLLSSRFFGICDDHRELRKSEINIYCIDCNRRMCSHCLASASSVHQSHQLLQIRRYVYQDVIRINDMQKLLDCSKVQPYVVNSAKVVLLNPRRQSKPSKAPAGVAVCDICRRTITEPNRYCCIACKVSEESVAMELNGCSDFNMNKSGPFVPPLTPDLEDLSPNEHESSSSLSSPHPSDSTTEENPDRWIKAALSPKRRIARRKGIPRRAPIF